MRRWQLRQAFQDKAVADARRLAGGVFAAAAAGQHTNRPREAFLVAQRNVQRGSRAGHTAAQNESGGAGVGLRARTAFGQVQQHGIANIDFIAVRTESIAGGDLHLPRPAFGGRGRNLQTAHCAPSVQEAIVPPKLGTEILLVGHHVVGAQKLAGEVADTLQSRHFRLGAIREKCSCHNRFPFLSLFAAELLNGHSRGLIAVFRRRRRGEHAIAQRLSGGGATRPRGNNRIDTDARLYSHAHLRPDHTKLVLGMRGFFAIDYGPYRFEQSGTRQFAAIDSYAETVRHIFEQRGAELGARREVRLIQCCRGIEHGALQRPWRKHSGESEHARLPQRPDVRLLRRFFDVRIHARVDFEIPPQTFQCPAKSVQLKRLRKVLTGLRICPVLIEHESEPAGKPRQPRRRVAVRRCIRIEQQRQIADAVLDAAEYRLPD